MDTISITEWDSETLIKYLKKKKVNISTKLNGEQIINLSLKQLKNMFPNNY